MIQKGSAARRRIVSGSGLDGLYDYSSLFEDPNLFLDTDHCNDEGAKILIRAIERDTGLRLAR